MPSVSIGINEVCAPALLADSGARHAADVAMAEGARRLCDLLLM
jgi:hypothetical protein